MVETRLTVTVPDNGVIELRDLPAGKEYVITLQEQAANTPKKLVGGWLKGKIHMSPDFDDPLEKLKEYM